MTTAEKITDDILRRLKDEITTEQALILKDSLFVVLSKYEIEEPSTELATIDNSWNRDLQRFLDRKSMSGKSEKTVERYRYVLSKVLAYINKPIDEITEGDLIDYLEKYKLIRNVSNSTLDGCRRCISSFFTWQHAKGYISRNPSAGIDPIKIPKVIKKAYSDEDMEKLRRECTQLRDMALVEFLYTTGVRVSELCALNRDDVKVTSREIIVYGKGAKEREVYLTPVSCMYLTAYLEKRTDSEQSLFVSTRKPYKRMTPGGVRAMLKKLGNRSGVEKVHPHRFRTTLATNLIKKGMPVEEVKTILGHESINTTLIYALIDQGKVKSDIARLLSA